VLFSILTLVWQLLVLFACSSALGLALRPLVPEEFSLLNKVFFSFIGGLFLVVLISQNLVYLGIPVRISAWLLLGAALVQVWLGRHKLVAFGRVFLADADIRTLAALILVTITFHGVVPIQQGLEWYAGKGYPDYFNYVQLAEFLKEEPYSTNEQDIGLHPWLLNPATGLKKERIGQSIITAEISTWSGTDGKGGYPATVIFFITVLAICVYIFLRETGLDHFMAGFGALLAALLPGVTRLSLDGFLSQTSILFIFPFFASLLRPRDLSAQSFTLFFSLTLAYVVAAYSEIAPIGFGTFFLGVMFVRRDKLRAKRLMLMSAVLLTVFMNIYYLPNLIEFLGKQYNVAAHPALLDNMSPNIVSLGGWAELIFGGLSTSQFALFFDGCAILLGMLFLTGVIFLSRRDWLVLGAILLPILLIISYLATRRHHASYPIAKIMLSILPFLIGLVFVALSRLAANNQDPPIRTLNRLFAMCIVAAAAVGSVPYYCNVLQSGGLLKIFRESHFLIVCRQLEETKDKRVFVFQNDILLTPWLCYHARHNDVYVDGRFINPSGFSRAAPFSKVPDLETIDFEVSPDRIIDLRNPRAGH
jgi:hypothetical protein